jgi:hypothetical protein
MLLIHTQDVCSEHFQGPVIVHQAHLQQKTQFLWLQKFIQHKTYLYFRICLVKPNTKQYGAYGGTHPTYLSGTGGTESEFSLTYTCFPAVGQCLVGIGNT